MKSVLALTGVAIALASVGCATQDPLTSQGVATYVKVPNRVVSQNLGAEMTVELGFINTSKRPIEIHMPLEEKGLSVAATHVFKPSHKEGQGPLRFTRGGREPIQVMPGDTLRARYIRVFRLRVRPGPYRLTINGSVRINGVPYKINPRPRWISFRNTNPWPEGASFDIPSR